MALKIPGAKNKLFEHSKETGEGLYNSKNPPQDIANKEEEYSIPAAAFQPERNSGLIIDIGYGICYAESEGPATYVASIKLPDGAKIKSCIVYGTNATKTYAIMRANYAGWAAAINGYTNIGTIQTMPGNIIVDNKNYQYEINATMVAEDKIYGAKIVYERNFI